MKTIERTDIHEENVSGEFFVNDQCIICELCFEIAPETFRANLDGDQSIVFKQPESEDQVSLAEESREMCPVDAIERDND